MMVMVMMRRRHGKENQPLLLSTMTTAARRTKRYDPRYHNDQGLKNLQGDNKYNVVGHRIMERCPLSPINPMS